MANKEFIVGLCSIYSEDGHHLVLTPSGETVPHLTQTKVIDIAGEMPVCEASFPVNIVSSKKEAMNHYVKINNCPNGIEGIDCVLEFEKEINSTLQVLQQKINKNLKGIDIIDIGTKINPDTKYIKLIF